VSFTGSRIETDDPQFQGNIFVARNITDRKRAERRIRYLAGTMRSPRFPTGCSSITSCSSVLRADCAAARWLHCCILDMDRFKEVNDTFGHAPAIGSEVLAERLTRTLPKDTVIGRLAGDEFALFVDGLPSDADNRGPIAHLARSILTEVSRGFQLNQHEVYLTASIGVAFCPRDAETSSISSATRNAAMYYSKQNGGNTFAFYSPRDERGGGRERLMLKSKLRRAVEARRTRDPLSAENRPAQRPDQLAQKRCLRWRLPGHGDVHPRCSSRWPRNPT